MKTTATNKKIRDLVTAINNETLIPQPEFQRRLVWTNRHKQLFIKTVLEGLPFPEIFLCDGAVDLETGQGTQQIVDGQQRITTLFQYFTASDDLRLGDVPQYHDLTDNQKRAFLNYDVVVRDLGSLEEKEIREVFHRMNSTNYGLNTMEVNNARFDGELKRAADSLSEDSFFDRHRVFTAVDIRRMNDVRWCLTLIITIISGYFSRDVEHEEYLEKYNDDFPEKEETLKTIAEATRLIEGLRLDGTRVWQKNDLFTLLVEISNIGPSKCIDQHGMATSLKSFYASVEAVTNNAEPDSTFKESAPAYRVDVISGSNERARRIRRGDVIRNLISPYFA